jgi:hypothetical protein
MKCRVKPVIGADGSSIGVAKLRSVEVIAGVNLLVYTFLLMIFLFLDSIFFGLFHFGVLYSIIGMICSYELSRHRKWSWYLAIAMWIGEGILASWAAYVSISSYRSVLEFLLIAILRLVSIAYFVTSKVTKSFGIGQHIVDDDL